MGETSAAVIRALGVGKPCIVSDDAWFSELPDEAVIKVNNRNIKEELHDSLLRLLDNPDLMEEISKEAREYIQREHGIVKISDEIADFLRS
jgi:glycosyltransferase involved in cell wall biosynthesis